VALGVQGDGADRERGAPDLLPLEAPPQRRAHARGELGRLAGLEHVVVGAPLERVDGLLVAFARADGDDGRLAPRVGLAQNLEPIEAVDAVQVDEGEIAAAGQDAIEPLGGRGGRGDVVIGAHRRRGVGAPVLVAGDEQ